MTNPKNKHTKEQFIQQVNEANGKHFELIIDDYLGVDHRYTVKCKHGCHELYGWQLKKPKKHCCKKGYWESKKKPVETSTKEFIESSKKIWKDKIDYSKCIVVPDAASKGKKTTLRCIEHDEWFTQWPGSNLNGRLGCKQCKSKQQSKITRQRHLNGSLGNANFISKAETIWLDSLQVPERQYILEDVEFYKVDGFNPNTNTVYLYHGRFWHGCPETYDPEEIHPIIKVKMKELYEKTLAWESKIKDAGYKLVTHWGD